jgi:hypothetical protein
MWLPLVAAGSGVAGAILADILASRAGAGRVSAYGISLLSGFAVTLLIFVPGSLGMRGLDQFASGMLTLLLYGAWWFIVLNFVQSFDSSLRVRILALLYAAGGRMPRATLEQTYNDEMLLGLRLQRLLTQGYAVERGGRVYITSAKLRVLAKFFRALKMTLLGYRSEFDRPGNIPSA